jgi:hypothetical protein
MPSALSSAMPPAPEMPQQNSNPSSGPLSAPASSVGQPGVFAAPQAPPAPTHDQTVATLRHVRYVGQELDGLLKDPDLGRADLKSKIIDGMTRLVSEGIVSPAAAVQQLSQVPSRPFDQKVWLQKLSTMNMQVGATVLAHHASAFAGQPEQPTPNRDGHMNDLKSMMAAHYAGRQ